MFQLLYPLVNALKPIGMPLCFVLAWGLILLLFWSLGSALIDSIRRAKKMHQIPCTNCAFFTDSYYLKCPVQPQKALSEAAIDCPDYQSK